MINFQQVTDPKSRPVLMTLTLTVAVQLALQDQQGHIWIRLIDKSDAHSNKLHARPLTLQQTRLVAVAINGSGYRESTLLRQGVLQSC